MCAGMVPHFMSSGGEQNTFSTDRPCLLSVIRDVTSRILEEQSLRRTVETHNHEQATLLEISHTLASTLELQPGLILDQLREIIEYTNGGLFSTGRFIIGQPCNAWINPS